MLVERMIGLAHSGLRGSQLTLMHAQFGFDDLVRLAAGCSHKPMYLSPHLQSEEILCGNLSGPSLLHSFVWGMVGLGSFCSVKTVRGGKQGMYLGGHAKCGQDTKRFLLGAGGATQTSTLQLKMVSTGKSGNPQMLILDHQSCVPSSAFTLFHPCSSFGTMVTRILQIGLREVCPALLRGSCQSWQVC